MNLPSGIAKFTVRTPELEVVEFEFIPDNPTPPPPEGAEPFFTSGAIGPLRNNFQGDTGFRFRTPTSLVNIVTELGRWKVAGNNQSHIVSVKRLDGTVVISATVDLANGTDDAYNYVPISPVTLEPNTEYALVSSEVDGGDYWHDLASYQDSGVAQLQFAVYQPDGGGPILTGGSSQVYVPVNMKMSSPPAPLFITFGDSKTNREGWHQILVANLANDGHPNFRWGNAGRPNATVTDSVPGTPSTGVDSLLVTMPADILAHPERANYVLMNWGVNDLAEPINQITWESKYSQIVEWAHDLYPNAKIYLAYPWRRGFDSECALMHEWVDHVIANHSEYTFAGVDEAIVIKGNDDGAAATTDGVHHSNPVGITLYAEATQVSLGF